MKRRNFFKLVFSGAISPVILPNEEAESKPESKSGKDIENQKLLTDLYNRGIVSRNTILTNLDLDFDDEINRIRNTQLSKG